MEILEVGEGWGLGGFQHETACPRCHTKVRLILEDAKRNSDYLGEFSSWFWDCPICAEQPDFPASLWPNITRLKRESIGG